MVNTKEIDYYSSEEVLNGVKNFLKYLSRRWLVIVLFIIIGAGVGVLYYKLQKPKYEALTTFILEEKSAGSGGLAGLASQFGFNVGGLTGGNIFSGDNILNILQSKKVVEQVLLSEIGDSSSKKTLADSYMEFTGLKKSFSENPAVGDISFAGLKQPLDSKHDSILNAIYESINKNNLFTDRTSKQSTIIKVLVKASDAQFARLMTERLVNEASKMYLNIHVGTAEENIRQLQRRSDSLLYLLNGKSYYAAASQPLDINPGLRTAIVPLEIANRDKTVLATLYAEVTKNLEASKLLLSQQTPVIQLLDQPGSSLRDNRKGLFLLILLFTVGATGAFILYSFVIFYFKNKNAVAKKHNPSLSN